MVLSLTAGPRHSLNAQRKYSTKCGVLQEHSTRMVVSNVDWKTCTAKLQPCGGWWLCSRTGSGCTWDTESDQSKSRRSSPCDTLQCGFIICNRQAHVQPASACASPSRDSSWIAMERRCYFKFPEPERLQRAGSTPSSCSPPSPYSVCSSFLFRTT